MADDKAGMSGLARRQHAEASGQGDGQAPGPARGMATIPRSFLLWIYAIVPLALAVAFADALFFGGALRTRLPERPEEILWYTLLFGLPHIAASAATFADREYLAHYAKRLAFPGLPLVALAFGLPRWMGEGRADVLISAWTISHTLGQQFGLTRTLSGAPDGLSRVWKNLGTTIGVLSFLSVFAMDPISVLAGPAFLVALAASFVVFAWLGAVIHWRSNSRVGRSYALANVIWLGAACGLLATGYGFFAIVVYRFVHELTAFLFYSVHNRNRNSVAARKRLPTWVTTPLAGILLALPLTLLKAHAWMPEAITSLAFLHFYFEGFIWKREGLHRRAVALS